MKKEIEYLSILKTTLLFLCLLMIFKTLIAQYYILRNFILEEEVSDFHIYEMRLFLMSYVPLFTLIIISIFIKIRFKMSWMSVSLSLLFSIFSYSLIHRKIISFLSITDSGILNSILGLGFFSIIGFYLIKSILVKKD